MTPAAERQIPVGTATVTALHYLPPHADPRARLVLAHGAGAGMHHAFLAAIAGGLADRGVATLRFEFPFMQQGARRPDPPAVAQAAVRAAVHEAARRLPQVPLFAGGKSFGGRMTSQAQALGALPGVHGLAFLGFPLHPAKQPSDTRARHLGDVQVPMLFLQGTHDALASLDLLQAVVHRLGSRATLHLAEGADHSFHVPARSGRTDADVRAELLKSLAAWTASVTEMWRPT